jgi:hypothetical protein
MPTSPNPTDTDNFTTRARRSALAALLALACLGLLAGGAYADAAPGLAKFAGQYKYAGTREQGIAIVDKALDEALSEMGMVMRMIVKKGAHDKFAETVLIEVAPPKVGIKLGALEKATVELGKSETVKGENGKTGKVTHTFDAGKLIETLTGDDGTISNVFTLAADGKTLRRSVTVTGGKLKKPIKYTLDYVRK